MAGKSKYDDKARSRAYVVWTANDHNVKRTARELSIPAPTVRSWARGWESDPPPAEALTEAAQDFLQEAMVTRDLAVHVIRLKLELLEKEPDKAKLAELSTVVGVLDDKIARAKGLATSRTEHIHTLPGADEIREVMSGFITGALEAARRREGEVIEAVPVEQPPKGLPRPRD